MAKNDVLKRGQVFQSNSCKHLNFNVFYTLCKLYQLYFSFIICPYSGLASVLCDNVNADILKMHKVDYLDDLMI